MKKRVLIPLLTLLSAIVARAQIGPGLSGKLNDSEWTARSEAYRGLLASSRTPAIDSALVSLLLIEDAEIRKGMVTNGESKGEGYSMYVSSLAKAVQLIAERNPARADVWTALATCDLDDDSARAKWLAMYGDKTAPLLKACAREDNATLRGHGIAALAQIISYEKNPATPHHLSQDGVDDLISVVHAALKDGSPYVRQQAVLAVAVFGTTADLIVLREIASTDPYIDRGIAALGPPSDPYLVRYVARLAIKDLQGRLGAEQ